jgi:hypothetical protein
LKRANVGVLAAVLLPVLGQAASPVLYFSDLDWGPKSGWEGSATRGAAVTVWGQNLGTARGSSYITVNGAALTSDADYAEWGATGPARGLSRITFWINAMAQDGPGVITVTVNGQTSNALPFTVAPGVIYFISPAGSNANNGLRASTQSAGNGPFRDLFMFNPGLDSMHSAANRNPSGDGQYIVYVRAGTYTTLDVDGAFLALRGPYGGPTRRKALVGYPGETPLLNAAAANRGVVWPANYSPYGRLSYFTFAKLNIVNGTWAYGLWGDYNRVVGNTMRDMLANAWTGVVMVDNSQYSKIYGNLFERCGYDSYKHNIYIKTHRDYVAGDKSVDYTDIGWNEFAEAWAGNDARGGVIFVSREGGTTGKYTGNTTIHNNYFRDGNMDFIYVGDSTPIGDVTVYNNVFRGGTSINGGITLYAGTTNAFFYNNTFYETGAANQPMIWATGTARAVFKNNIWHSRSGQRFFLLESWQGATINSERDLFFNPGGSTTPPSGTNITVTGAVTANPMFVNPSANDYRLLPGSPAIDAGTAAVAGVVSRDYDGNPRPQGVTPDIGAFEFLSGTPAVVVAVAPSSVSLQGGGSQQFTASVSGASNTAVSWSMNPILGTLNNGLYTAPLTVASAQTVTITATSIADPSRAASAVVNLIPPPQISVSVSPASVSLGQGQSQQFAAAVTGATNTAVTWSLSAPVGTVSASGLYTAPATISAQQTVQLIATSVADSAKSAVAVITLIPPAPPVSVSVSPASVSLGQGQSQQFAAAVTGATNTAVTWSLSAPVGTVSASGLYTAPATISAQQTVQVIATSVADPSRRASASITLTPPPPAIAVTVTPASVTLQPGQTAQFSANVPVTWSLSAPVGSISATGLYTAPAASQTSLTSSATSQTVLVVARSTADPSLSATARVELLPQAAPYRVSWTRISNRQVRVDWVAPAGRPARDYLVLTGYGSPHWWYIWERTTGGKTEGSFTLDLPTNIGLWEFRYYLAGGSYQLAARSAPLAVKTESFGVTAGQTSVTARGALTVTFTAPPGRPTGWADIVGLYRTDAANDAPVWREYTRGATQGTFTLAAPATAGTYEFRYVIDRTAAAVSLPVSVR